MSCSPIFQGECHLKRDLKVMEPMRTLEMLSRQERTKLTINHQPNDKAHPAISIGVWAQRFKALIILILLKSIFIHAQHSPVIVLYKVFVSAIKNSQIKYLLQIRGIIHSLQAVTTDNSSFNHKIVRHKFLLHQRVVLIRIFHKWPLHISLIDKAMSINIWIPNHSLELSILRRLI